MLVLSIIFRCHGDSAGAVFVLERDYSRDRLWCLLVLSLDAHSDRVGVSIDRNMKFKVCLCSPMRFLSYLIH